MGNVMVDPKQKYLLQVASDVLDSTEFADTHVIKALTIVPADWLISMKGDRLLQDITDAEHNPHQARLSITYLETSSSKSRKNRSKVAKEAYKTIWRSQTTALARYEQEDVRLAPHRLIPIRERSDPLELLSFLVHECGLEPMTVAQLGLTRMTNSKEWIQCTREREELKDILTHLLHKVVILAMQGDHVSDPEGVVQIMMEAVLADGKNCQLRYLFIRHVTKEFMSSLSPHFFAFPDAQGTTGPLMPSYQGVSVIQLGVTDLESASCISALLDQQPQLKCVQLDFDFGRDTIEACSNSITLFSTLSSLFSRSQFKFMKLELKNESSLSSPLLQELLCGFMRAPCENGEEQSLTVTSESSSLSIFSQKEAELASVDVSSGGVLVIPDCGVQHKKLSFTSNLQSVVGSLLQLSTIRVNKINFDCHSDHYPYLHQAAVHPDLHVMAIRVYFQFCPFEQLLTTVETDLITLLKKPSLKEVMILGYWNKYEEVKSAVEKALLHRAQVGPIHKLVLYTFGFTSPLGNSDDRRHTKEQILSLWKAIFSLPHLDELEVVVAGGICITSLQNEESIYETWKQVASGMKFKSLKVGNNLLSASESEEHHLLSDITHKFVVTKSFRDI